MNENAEDIESANEIYFRQNFRVLNTNEIIENYISRKRTFTESLSSKSIRSSKSRVNSNSSPSQSNTSSSSSVSRKRVKAELLLKQSHERFEKKSKSLEKQKSSELELERENIIEVENQLKLLELKDDYNLDKENSLSDAEHPFICPSQITNDKVKSYLSSLTREPHPRLTENYLLHSPRPENHSSQVLNLSQDKSLSQLDQARKVEIINSDTYLVEHISKTSLPNEPPPPQSPSYSQFHHNKTVTDQINLESLESKNPEPVDQFIDYLIEGKETVIPGEEEISLKLNLNQELETRNLPIVNLVSFDRNPCTRIYNRLKGALSSLRQFLATESPLKITKNAFYFTLKALFILQIFKFLSWPFGHEAKRLNKKG